MSTAIDSLAPEAVAAHLHGRFGTPYLYVPECESSQTLLLGSGLPEGAVAATDHQTARAASFSPMGLRFAHRPRVRPWEND